MADEIMTKKILCAEDGLAAAGRNYIAGCLYNVTGTEEQINRFGESVFTDGYADAAKACGVLAELLIDFDQKYWVDNIESEVITENGRRFAALKTQAGQAIDTVGFDEIYVD